MQTLSEAKFPRTGKEYKLEKTETGFNLRLIDLDDTLTPVFKTFNQLLELSQSGQIVFTGFEEKKNEAELILLNCIHQLQVEKLQVENQQLTTANEQLKSENEQLKSENEQLTKEKQEAIEALKLINTE